MRRTAEEERHWFYGHRLILIYPNSLFQTEDLRIKKPIVPVLYARIYALNDSSSSCSTNHYTLNTATKCDS